MLVLLPPSETKRDGGADGSSLDLGSLGFPELTPARRSALAALRSMSKSIAVSTKALGLGPTQRFEIDRNRAISGSPTMPAIERYTGVLFDAVGVETLPPSARAFIGEKVLVHSALFGLVRGTDPIPAYRFSHDTRIAGTTLAKIWREANASVLRAQQDFVLDLRSEGYVQLGPAGERAEFLRVVSDDGSGHRRVLNHFNKHGKGALVRAIAEAGIDFESPRDLLDWARTAGIAVVPGAAGGFELIV